MREIAEQIELPESLATFGANRGYYGSLYHDVAATYVLYLGWFDGNPATLNQLPPAEASKNYVAFMGGADAVLAKARESYAKGEYSGVAEVRSEGHTYELQSLMRIQYAVLCLQKKKKIKSKYT